MQNVLIIGAIVVVGIGGYLLLSSPDMSDPATGTANEPVTDSLTVTGNTMTDETATPDPAEAAMEADEMMQTTTIVDAAMNTPTLSTLVTAVTSADLVDTLSSSGPFTVFAPTDSAFANLPEGTLNTLLQPENIEQLQGILTYHVVPGSVMAEDLSDGMNVTTVNGEEITITVDADGAVMINDSATVVTADVQTDNGVVHIIDSVLLPPTE